jgi:hypothetical protein
VITVTLVGPDNIKSVVTIKRDSARRRYSEVRFVLSDCEEKWHMCPSFYYASGGRR